MNSRKHLFFLFSMVLLSVILISGCNKKNKAVVAEIGSEKILMFEFENQFLKSLGNNLDSAKNTGIEQRKSFLDLMVNLKLKVLDAKEKGYLDSPAIKEELENYKKSYLSAFLVDKKVTEPYIKELYEKKKFEIRASHILVNLPQNPQPADSIRAYEKANKILDRLKNGEDFGTVAMEESDDQSAKSNKGDLYYFTGGMTVPEFEEVVYKLNVGEYNKKPIRSMFGLHIVKITDKKKRSDGIKASHILIQDIRDTAGKVTDSTTSLKKAQEIYDRLKKGEDFAALATQYSDDPGSKTKGGDLGFFDRRRMVLPFDSAAFTLKVGEFSTPVRTPYGYHIIKVTEIKPYPSFEKAKENLKNEFKRGMLYKNEYDKYVSKILVEHGFKVDESGLANMLSKIDTTKIISNNNLDSIFASADKNLKVADYRDGKVTLQDVLLYLQNNKEMASSPANKLTISKITEQVATQPILTAEAVKENIEKDEDYLALMNEYTAGLLREKIDLEQISSKIKIEETDVQAYYNSHIQQFTIKTGEKDSIKTVAEAKPEIENILRQDKFKEIEKTYLESLKQKYPVKINMEELSKAFKN